MTQRHFRKLSSVNELFIHNNNVQLSFLYTQQHPDFETSAFYR